MDINVTPITATHARSNMDINVTPITATHARSNIVSIEIRIEIFYSLFLYDCYIQLFSLFRTD